MRDSGRRKILFSLRLLFGLALLGWLFSTLDWGAIRQCLKSLTLAGWLGGLAIYLAAQAVSSLRWWLAGRQLGLKTPLFRYIELYFVGMFFNLFLPTSVGGDFAKSFFLGRENKNQLNAAFSVVLERVTGLVALLCIGAGALFFAAEWFSSSQALFLSLLAVASLAGVWFAPFFLGKIARFVPVLGKWLEPAASFRKAPGLLATILALSAVIQLLGIVIVAMLARQIGVQMPFSFYCSSFAIITLVAFLPISVNGVGIREAGFAFFFQQAGLPVESGVVLGLLVFSIHSGSSLLGMIPFLYGGYRRPLETVSATSTS